MNLFSDPVFGKDFFDREEILQLIQKRIHSFEKGYRQNMALLGHPFVGKTSILFEILHRWGSTKISPVYFEIREESPSSFAERFMASFLFRTEKGEREERETVKRGAVYQEAKSLLDHGDIQKGWMRLLDLMDTHVQEIQRPCLMILDEFHLLEQILGPHAFSALGNKILMHRQVMYILSSSSVSHAREIIKTKFNLLFGQFEIIPVEPFRAQTAEEFLKDRLSNAWQKSDRSFLIAVTNGSPFYLDVLTKYLQPSTLLNEPKHAIMECFKAVLFSNQGSLSQYFSSRISSLNDLGHSKNIRANWLKILLAIAYGHHRITEIISYCNISKNTILQVLKLSLTKNLIEKNGTFYLCPDPLFRFWIKSVYSYKALSPGGDFENREKVFQEDVLKLMKLVIQENETEVHDRISNLLTSFKNDLILFQNKTVKFPCFQKTAFEQNGTIPHMIGYLPNSKRWKWLIYANLVQEEDMEAIKGSTQTAEESDQRKIIVALRGMASNATLLAKESKLWAWDLNDLNQLLELYGKQRIIL